MWEVLINFLLLHFYGVKWYNLVWSASVYTPLLLCSTVFLAVAITTRQGLEEGLSDCPGQVDFPAVQVTFISTCLMGQVQGKLSAHLAQGNQNLRVACLKGKLKF